MKSKITIISIVLIFVAALARLIPHPSNVTPMAAMAMVGGAYLSRKYIAFLIPILALYFSDLLLNNTILRSYFPNNEGVVWFANYMLWVYIGFAAIIVVAMLLLKKVKFSNLVLTTLLGSIAFFIISNFGVWLTGTMYTKDLAGLISCYTMAIPFFKYSLLGNIAYVFVLFGAIEFTSLYILKLKTVEA
jgi:hypothetical protein